MFEAHRQRMIDHFIWPRHRDAECARHALDRYVAMPACPYPKIAGDVRERWSQSNG